MLLWSSRPPHVVAAGTVGVDVPVLHDCDVTFDN